MRMDIGMAADDTTNAALRAPTAAERAQQFERDGYIVARQMFSHGEMRDFIAECQSYEGKNAHRVEPNSAGSMQFYSEIYRRRRHHGCREKRPRRRRSRLRPLRPSP